MTRTRHVVVLAMEGCHSLNVLGPVEVFYRASLAVPGAYELDVVGPTSGGNVRMDNGLRLGVAPLPEPPPRHDTLVVAGWAGAPAAADEPAVVDWVQRASQCSRRTASVCTGAYMLAAAGILDGRRATTHWAYAEDLGRRFGRVVVDADPVYINDGDVWTSAGSTAGIDLALALVDADLGPRTALTVARELVVFLKRPGGQSQFSSALAAQQATRPELRDLQAWIAGQLDQDLTVQKLADRVLMSERSFARVFQREVGQTPAAYVEALRVERARILLEDGAPSLEGVARLVGFANAEILRRAFQRRLGISPSAYRGRFRLPELAAVGDPPP
jgi:transcriptional regulator GlxA family with amidase domain